MTNACHILGVFGAKRRFLRLGRDLGRGMYRNSPLLHFADFIAALPRYLVISFRHNRPLHLLCCMLSVDIIFAPRFGAADGAARKDLGGGGNGKKKVFIYFF